MSKHKALELAEKLYDNGEVPSLEECSRAASELRAQHALIVKMREALKDAADQTRHPDYDWPIWLSNQIDAAIEAADQYLGEKA